MDNPKTIMNQNQNLTSNPFDSVGFLHNKICDHYKRYYQTLVNNRYYKYNNESYITMDTYLNIMDAVEDYLINKEKEDPEYVRSQVDEVKNILSDFGCFYEINGNKYFKIITNYHDFLEYLRTTDRVDQETYSYLEPIYKDGYPYTNLECETRINGIRQHLYETNWGNQTLAKYLSVYEYSDLFWSPEHLNLDNPDTLICGLNPNQALIVADAIGAALASKSYFGALIASTLMSLAEAEDQENHCSVLVGSEYVESYYYPGNGGNPKKKK